MLSLKNIYYAVSEFPLLDNVNLDIAPNERIALIGRNGEGKSTLLKIISGAIVPEGGEIIKPSFLRVSRLAQELPESENITVFEAVSQGLQDLSDLLVRYHKLTLQEADHDEQWMKQVTTLQQDIEHRGGWQIQQRIERVIDALALPAEKKMNELSGGWRRRVGLAQALVQEPDILLLDEPTNHLDLTAIQWLEEMLLNYPKTILFITHDRALLRKLATKIIELDRGKLTTFPSDYDVYLSRKEQMLQEEERHNALFDKKLSEEEQWIRQGIKARRTRNEGRVRALKALREERKQRRVRQEKPLFVANDLNQAGKTVIQADNVSFAYDGKKPLIQDFTFTIQRGDKIAIVGANGSGKTTLVKLLLGLLKPTSGKIKQSPVNQMAFFDQNREEIHKEETVMANVSEGDDFIEIQGKKKHVIGYLGDFLFSPAKCKSLARTLSGGEQNRLMLAKLFSKPANVIVLDEPTNDLDMESLDVLENLLLTYSGTVILISHDREFIDNIATHTIAFENDGTMSISVGGYTDWLQRQKTPSVIKAESVKEKKTQESSAFRKKLSYKEQRELESLPSLIQQLENEISRFHDMMCQAEFHKKPKEEIALAHQQLAEKEAALAKAYERWEALEAKD